MAETSATPAADQLRVLRAAQGFLSKADARRSADGGRADDAHLDSFASASAGLMQLSSAAADEAKRADGGGGGGADEAKRAERPLPPGWNRIIHASGLPCFANFRLGIVCWSKPYALGADAAQLAEPDFTRLVKKHVPPAGIFTPPERAVAANNSAAPAGPSASSIRSVASSPPRAAAPQAKPVPGGASSIHTTASSGSGTAAHTAPAMDEAANAKKRKLDAGDRAVHISSRASDKFSAMSLEDFGRLAIGDPRVLQGCMELAVKTPAQVLQEYQNRNRGVSINYNTVPVEEDGVKLFKTIVTAGSTVAEGIASTKKIAKQLGAQQLLAVLHQRSAQTYLQVADAYSGAVKGQPGINESSMAGVVPATAPSAASLVSGQTISNSLRSVGTPGRIVDARFVRANSGGGSNSGGSSIQGLSVAAAAAAGGGSAGSGSQLRKFRRASPTREYGHYEDAYSDTGLGAPNQWEEYHQQAGAPSWAREGGHVDSPGPERIVVYSSPSSATTNYASPYYTGGHAPWTHAPPGGLPLPPPPQQPAQAVQASGGYANRFEADRGAAVPLRQHTFGGAYRSRSSERASGAKQPQVRYQPHPSE